MSEFWREKAREYFAKLEREKGYPAKQELPVNPVPLGGSAIPPKDRITQHIAISIPAPTSRDPDRQGVPMPAKTPVLAYAQEAGRFSHCLDLMERVLSSTLREVAGLRSRCNSRQNGEPRGIQTESLATLVHHNLGQCQDYINDAVSSARQLDAMLAADKETEDGNPLGS